METSLTPQKRLSLQDFERKLLGKKGKFDRLEIRSDGKLHRQGATRVGKAVQWLSKSETLESKNAQVMTAFVAALKEEHGEVIGELLTKPLRDRTAQLSSTLLERTIQKAWEQRVYMRGKNQHIGLAFSPANVTPEGYRSAVIAAQAATGARDEVVINLFDPGQSAIAQLGDDIRQAVRMASEDGRIVVGAEDAHAIAQRVVTEFLLGRMLTAAFDQVILHKNLEASPSVTDIVERVKPCTVRWLRAEIDGSADEQAMQVLMEYQVRRLSDTELLRVNETLLSGNWMQVLLTLTEAQGDDPKLQFLLRDLTSYVAFIKIEVDKRSQVDYGFVSVDVKDDYDSDFVMVPGAVPGQLAALARTQQRAAENSWNRQDDAFWRGKTTGWTEHPGATGKLSGSGVTVEQVTQALLHAELTINVSIDLFRKKGPFRDDKGRLKQGDDLRVKNLFEVPRSKDQSYYLRRQLIESLLEPATREADKLGVEPHNHPVSAAVNMGRNVLGGAPDFGEVVLSLKDSVRSRCTYTPGDSYNAFEAKVTAQKIAQYRAKVEQLIQSDFGLPSKVQRALRERPEIVATIFTELEKMVGKDFGAHRSFLTDFLRGPMAHLGGRLKLTPVSQLTDAAIGVFAEAAQGSRHVTTQEWLPQMIADWSQEEVDEIVEMLRDDQRINKDISRSWIEAQIYGGVYFWDVAEIRYIAQDTSAMTSEHRREYDDHISGLKLLAKEFEIRVVELRPEDATRTHRT